MNLSLTIATCYCNLQKKIDDIVYVDDTEVNVAAKGDSQRVAWINPAYMICSGNSLACAHVSSLIVKYIDGCSRQERYTREPLNNATLLCSLRI